MASLRKLFIVTLLGVAAACFIYVIHLDAYYCENGVRESRPAEGRVRPRYVCHGTRVFLTAGEEFDFNVLLPCAAIGSFLAAGLLNMRWKCFRISGGEGRGTL